MDDAVLIRHIEPRVLSVAEKSPLRVGDTVISVDREAITTAEGSEAFTYPMRAIHQVEVRRNGTKAVLFREVTTECSAHVPQATAVGPPQPYTVEIGAGEIDTGNYGFALPCRCCRRTARGISSRRSRRSR